MDGTGTVDIRQAILVCYVVRNRSRFTAGTIEEEGEEEEKEGEEEEGEEEEQQ